MDGKIYTKNLCYDSSSWYKSYDSSEIIARMQNFFSCHLPVVKRWRFFNASYSFHIYLIELMFDVDYRL